jgi:hypothetical protein
MSLSKWLLAANVSGIERRPLEKFEADAEAMLKLLQQWRDEPTAPVAKSTSFEVVEDDMDFPLGRPR